MGCICGAFGDSSAGELPKDDVLMVGLDAAGKTTCLRQLSKSEDTTVPLPTIGFNVERISYKGLTFSLWDVGGQIKLRQIWQHYYSTAKAVVFVIDSNDAERLTVRQTKDTYSRSVKEETMFSSIQRHRQRRSTMSSSVLFGLDAANKTAANRHIDNDKAVSSLGGKPRHRHTVGVEMNSWKTTADATHNGAKMVADKTERESERLKSTVYYWMEDILSQTERQIPVLLLANKQDLPNALTVSQIIDSLDLIGLLRGRQWHIQATVATEGKGVMQGFDWLCQQLFPARKQRGIFGSLTAGSTPRTSRSSRLSSKSVKCKQSEKASESDSKSRKPNLHATEQPFTVGILGYE